LAVEICGCTFLDSFGNLFHLRGTFIGGQDLGAEGIGDSERNQGDSENYVYVDQIVSGYLNGRAV
jgi:hypothetical protein